eukprot:Polyplicarium_translucidae@DN3312_c0_g1_i1.p1
MPCKFQLRRDGCKTAALSHGRESSAQLFFVRLPESPLNRVLRYIVSESITGPFASPRALINSFSSATSSGSESANSLASPREPSTPAPQEENGDQRRRPRILVKFEPVDSPTQKPHPIPVPTVLRPHLLRGAHRKKRKDSAAHRMARKSSNENTPRNDENARFSGNRRGAKFSPNAATKGSSSSSRQPLPPNDPRAASKLRRGIAHSISGSFATVVDVPIPRESASRWTTFHDSSDRPAKVTDDAEAVSIDWDTETIVGIYNGFGGHWEHRVRWETAGGIQVENDRKRNLLLDFSEDGTLLFVVDPVRRFGRTICLARDVESPEGVVVSASMPLEAHRDDVTSVSLKGCGSHCRGCFGTRPLGLVSGGRDELLHVWDFRPEQLWCTWSSPAADEVLCVRWLWRREIVHGGEVGTCEADTVPEATPVWSSHSFVSSSQDGSVQIWDTRKRGGSKCALRLGGHASAVPCLTFGGPGGAFLVSGGTDGLLKVWDCRSAYKPVVEVDAGGAIVALEAGAAMCVAVALRGRRQEMKVLDFRDMRDVGL